MTQKDQARDLLTRYREGRLSPEEKRLLDSWYNRQAEAGDAQLSDAEMDETIRSLAASLPLEAAKVKRLWPRIAAAASVLVACSLGLYYGLHQQPKPQTAQLVKNDITPGHNQATLTLANGKKIVLTKGLNGILATQGKTTIQAGNNDIAYNNTQTADQLVYNTLSTARGEQSPYPLVLADGTKVWLNAQSSITFPTIFNGKERMVKLTGEAYFEVKHNAAQPFKVQTANQTIEDIGTSFDVNAYGDEQATTTTLVEGSVKVGSVILKPGQQFNGAKVTAVSTAQYTAWKNGDFDFRGDRIESVMRQLARWYNIEVIYQQDLKDKVVYAQISRSKNISSVLNLLEATKGIHFKVEGRRVTVIE